MFATTRPRELAQETTRVVPCRELAPNIGAGQLIKDLLLQTMKRPACP